MTSNKAQTARSKDGTPIVYEHNGEGPPLVFVDGAFCSRVMGPGKQLATTMSHNFTTIIYDRRGRGDSGGTHTECDPQREVDDLAAVIEATDGTPFIFGHSSGAVLALMAIAAGVPAAGLALYEPPLIIDDSRKPVAADLAVRLQDLVGRGRSRAVVRAFMNEAVDAPVVLGWVMSFMPGKASPTRLAASVPNDAALLSGYQQGQPLLASHWEQISVPSLVLMGGKSPRWIGNAAHAVTAAIPNARLEVLPGQRHMVKPKVTVPLLRRFFEESTSTHLPLTSA